MFNRNKTLKTFLSMHFIIVMLLIFMPLFMIIAFSFNEATFPGFPWSGFTLEWYKKLFSDEKMMSAIANSVIVGISTAALSTLTGLAGAISLSKSKRIIDKFTRIVSFMPPLIPFILSGIAFVTFLNYFPLPKSLFSIIIFQSVLFFPISLGVITLKINELPAGLRNVSKNLGSTYPGYFFKVLLPLLKNTLIGVALLMFVLSWDEFVISWFVSGFQETIPIRVWSLLKSSITPKINALGTISFIISLILLIVAQRYLFKNKKRGKNETQNY